MTHTLIALALPGLFALVMAGLNLHTACQAYTKEAWPWFRHAVLLSNLWTAVGVIVGALIVVTLK